LERGYVCKSFTTSLVWENAIFVWCWTLYWSNKRTKACHMRSSLWQHWRNTSQPILNELSQVMNRGSCCIIAVTQSGRRDLVCRLRFLRICISVHLAHLLVLLVFTVRISRYSHNHERLVFRNRVHLYAKIKFCTPLYESSYMAWLSQHDGTVWQVE
jgi:hypothetical protein